jgi:hypothetical protein
MKKVLVNLLKIDPKRLSFVNFDRRRLQNYQSFKILSSITDEKSGFDYISEFSNEELSEAIGAVVNSISKLNLESMNGGKWINEPIWKIKEESLIINFTSNVEGTVFCQIEKSPDLSKNITKEQVYFSKDRNWEDNSNNSYSFQVSENEAYEYFFNFSDYPEDFYETSCILCNSFPFTPNCSNVSSSSIDTHSTSSKSIFLCLSLIYYLI